MGKHVEKVTLEEFIGEVNARDSIPREWPGLREAVKFLRDSRKGKHVEHNGFGTPNNAGAMRDWYRGE